jgi:hypothetical protein
MPEKLGHLHLTPQVDPDLDDTGLDHRTIKKRGGDDDELQIQPSNKSLFSGLYLIETGHRPVSSGRAHACTRRLEATNRRSWGEGVAVEWSSVTRSRPPRSGTDLGRQLRNCGSGTWAKLEQLSNQSQLTVEFVTPVSRGLGDSAYQVVGSLSGHQTKDGWATGQSRVALDLLLTHRSDDSLDGGVLSLQVCLDLLSLLQDSGGVVEGGLRTGVSGCGLDVLTHDNDGQEHELEELRREPQDEHRRTVIPDRCWQANEGDDGEDVGGPHGTDNDGDPQADLGVQATEYA